MASHPTKIGKYNVEGTIGRGGMGVVYKAVDSQIGRYVAIKMITAGGDPSLLERFKSEARSTGSLQCPNIVTVYDFGEQDGNPYLVMQYLEGSSLESMIQQGISLTMSERLGIIIDVCNGLAYAHQRGVIHRDIKPANIMVLKDGVNDGMAVIVDFGIARIGGDTRLTRTDQIIGSYHYMSAEQVQSKEVDNRADIYATGVVLFQLLTGALPFEAPEAVGTLYKIVNEPPPPLSAHLKDYPVELEAIMSRVLAKKREERYATAKDLAFDLMQVQEHLKSETVAQLFQRADVSLRREEWTRAREHLQQVLRLDRQNTQAQKLMNAVQERLRQQQQIEQARGLRGQADEAYMDQRYDDALRLLDQAVVLDPKNDDLLSYRDSVRTAKDRATGLRRALRRAEAALQDGDLDEAQNAVGDAFKIDPQDTQAKALKAVIAQHADEKSRQEQVRKLLDQARTQIAARNLTSAFASLKSAGELDPTSNELQSVAKMAMAAREQEKRRAETEELCRQIEASAERKDYASAVAKAEEGLRKFPQEQRLLQLKALAQAQQLRIEQNRFVREQFAAANSLADARQFLQAIALLDRALQRVPGNGELEDLRSTIRDRLAAEDSEQQNLQNIDATLAEAGRVLQAQGARSAREFLDANAVQYLETPQIRDFYAAVLGREALDDLDSRLASESNPAKRVQFAEEALRSNPDNQWIRQRLVDLQQVKAEISSAIDRARKLEFEERFSDAIAVWQQLQSAYPQVSEFETQIRRLASDPSKSRKGEPPAPQQLVSPSPDRPSGGRSATSVFDSASVLPDAPPTRTAPTAGASPKVQVGSPTQTKTPPAPPSQGLLAGSKKYVAAAGALVLVIAVIYLVFGGGEKAVTFQVTTSPPGATVTMGSQKCTAPCILKMTPGKYEMRVEHSGYSTVTQPVEIASDTKSLPEVVLPASPPPQPPPPPQQQGTLVIRANVEGAAVYLDNDPNPQGLTNAKSEYKFDVDVGGHEVSLRKSGYEDSRPQHVDIAKGRAETLRIKLEKSKGEQPTPPAFVLVQSEPGATVSVDGRFVGNVKNDRTLLLTPKPGPHSLEVTLDNYSPWSGPVNAESGKQVSVVATLTKKALPPPPAPTIAYFKSSSSALKAGESAQLSWQTENANEVRIDHDIGKVEASSSKQVQPSADIMYTLTATGPGGSTTATATIKVAAPPAPPPNPPVIDTFVPGLDSIQQGQSTKLIWSTRDASSVSIDPGFSDVPKSGTRQVTPTQTTKYTLTAKGQAGDEATSSVTVTVTPKTETPTTTTTAKAEAHQCIDRFKEAYESMDIKAIVNAWPPLANDSKKRNAINDSFKGARAIRLDDNCAEPPSISGDTARYQCTETMRYTIGGSTQKPQTNSVEFVCKKTPGGWLVDSRSVK